MSFGVSGSTWTPMSSDEYALVALARINAVLTPLGKTIVASTGNVIWLFCLAIGKICSAVDAALSSAKNSFNIALCDDAQILNLLPIAGTSLIPGAYSSLAVKFTATSAGSLVIPTGTHISVAGQSVKFVTQEDHTILASGSLTITTLCDTIGPISVASAQVTGTVETLTNMASVINEVSAIVGRNTETIQQVRSRLVTGDIVQNNIDGLTTSLRSLAGIRYASVWFNYGTSGNLILTGGKSVPPRTVYIVVYGSSPLIAATYCKGFLAPTTGTLSQNYSSLTGQVIPVYYDVATLQPVYVKVYVSANLYKASGYSAILAQIVAGISANVTIGQLITSEFVGSFLTDKTYCTVTGVTVSADNVTFGRMAAVSASVLPVFYDVNVSFVEE